VNELANSKSVSEALRRARPILLPVLALAGGVVAFFGLSSLQPARPAPTVQERVAFVVRVAPITPRTVTLDVIGHGSARVRDTVQLGTEVGGRVAYVSSSLRVGSFVAKGEVLVRLDDREHVIAQHRAKADVDRVTAELQRLVASEAHIASEVELRRERVGLAHAEWQRQTNLKASGVASGTRIDQARSAWVQEQTLLRSVERALDLLPHDLAAGRAALGASRATLEQADYTLERLVLRAPLPSQVRARQVDVGQVVAPGTPLIALAGHDVYEVPVQLSHENLLKLARIPNAALPRGIQAPPGRVGPSPATVASVAQPGATWQGRVTRVESVDATTRTVPVVVEVADPWASLALGAPLLPGAYCRVRLLGQTRVDAWVVPEHSLREGERLYVLRDGALVIVSIRVDHFLDGEAVITPAEPLRDGDRLILSPIPYPIVGMALRVEGSE
jgi:multidrug efflux pump subunit AcrA (membrane-fusion protein)